MTMQHRLSYRIKRLSARGRVGLCLLIFTSAASGLAVPRAAAAPRVPGIKVGKFPVEIRTVTNAANGLPADDVLCVALVGTNEVYAGTTRGLARFDGRKWAAVASVAGPVKLLAPFLGGVLATTGNRVQLIRGAASTPFAPLPPAAKKADDLRGLAVAKSVLLATRAGLFESGPRGFAAVGPLDALLGADRDVRQVAAAADGRVAVVAAGGLFLRAADGSWKRLNPADGSRSWQPRDVRGVAFDSHGKLWFASPQGAGSFDGKEWSLYTGDEGLPYNDFTTLAAGENGVVWFGTTKGAIRYDGTVWNFRQGERWLPDDGVRSIAVSAEGHSWLATKKGLSRIERRSMTLAEKAENFEAAIDKYHRRTPYGFVLDVNLDKPGNTSHPTQHDSDNDGLWTGMYGAGECFAYAATHDPKAKARARQAFEALRFLSQVTQGGPHPAPKGFPARSILPTSGPDPNVHDSPEHDRKQQLREPLWKVISPRWPKSADGKWYWKTDTSSDELDGHFFLYACYYDLVAETEAEKKPVREVVAAVAGHLLDHDFNLVDHDGKPTRWARFGPQTLNQVTWAFGRGLNSLSILSYLLVAEHVTGERRFRDAFDRLVKEHGYLANIMFPKLEFGPGTGNQSDDEMAFMCYYDLLRYATDPEVRRAGNTSLRYYWVLEEPEQSPLFNFIFAGSYVGDRRYAPPIPDSVVSDGLDFLKRYPLDRLDWGFHNSHRLDIIQMARYPGRRFRTRRGQLRTGKVLPIDERFIEHWNYDAWSIDGRGTGKILADGASYLLPYYMGRYLGFIIEDSPLQAGR